MTDYFKGKRVQILIADDDLPLGNALARALRGTGHVVELVGDGVRAVERLEAAPVDLLITDWMMPVLDGLGLLRHVRSKLPYRCAVVMHSGLTQSTAKAFALESGADAYLSKPTPLRTLVETLNGLASRIPKPTVTVGARSHETMVSSSWWSEFDSTIAGVLCSCTGIEGLRPTHAQSQVADYQLGAVIAMVDSKRQLELHVSVNCSMVSASLIGKKMLHVPNAPLDLLCDLMGELSNSVVGFAKIEFREQFTFTLGLPVFRKGPPIALSFDRVRTACLESGPVRVVVEAGIRTAPTTLVKASALRENMIVVDDVTNDAGVLLVPAGTLITETTAERIIRHGSKRDIRVASVSGT